jgi:putative aldouronate transport system substrate-binding protein
MAHSNDSLGCPECREVERISRSMSRRTALKGAAAIAAGAAAAGTVSSVAGQGTPAASPTGQQVDPTTDQPQQTFPLTEETKTLRVMVPSSPFVQDFVTNEFTAWLEERTHVHIEWEVLPLDTDGTATTALNVRLASGEYAEVLMDFDPEPSVLQLYGQQGVFQPLNDYIDQLGVYSKAAFEQYPQALQASTAADGNIYSLPQINDCFHCSMSQKLWINQQWLETLGIEAPATLEQYAEALRAFKANDPNGNGQADELPLTGARILWHGPPEEFFANAFLYHPGNELRLIVVDGKVTPIYTQDGWREMIAYLAGLSQEGLLDPEIFTRDRDQARAVGDGSGGPDMIVGSIASGWWGEFTTYTSGEEGPWQQYTSLAPLEGPGGVRYAGYNPFVAAIVGSFIITDKCANPELAFAWADSLMEIEATTRSIHGVKDRDWAWANEGDLGINGEQAIWKSITNIANVPSQNAHWSQTGPTYRSNAYRLGEYVPEEDAPRHVEVILYNETRDKYEPYQQPAEMALPPLYFGEEASQFVAELAPTIEAAVDETLALAVTGQSNIDEAWEGYLASLESMGLEQFIAYHQEAFDGASGG